MHRLWFVAAIVLGALQVQNARSADESRGELLYQNHCDGCHTSQAHIRDARKAQSKVQIFQWVHRWSVELDLPWGPEEIEDVTTYLNRRFYHFDADS